MTDNRPSRRAVLSWAATAAVAGAAGAGAATVVGGGPAPVGSPPAVGVGLVGPYGVHQVAIGLPAPEVLEAVALDLRPATDSEALGRLLRALTGSIESLTSGRGALGDPTPWLADAAARLTVTVGLGPDVVGRLAQAPAGFGAVPLLSGDRLSDRWSGGDLLLLVGARDGTTAAHAVRRLTSDAAPFATVRWRQSGTWNSVDARGRAITGRNLFGQVDGTANPVPEHDDLDLAAAVDGVPAVAANAHARLAHPLSNGGARIFRQGANYVLTDGPRIESGLIFASSQADLGRQLVPMLRRLDELDALNEWTTTVGSATSAILPGLERGGWLGESLLAPAAPWGRW